MAFLLRTLVCVFVFLRSGWGHYERVRWTLRTVVVDAVTRCCPAVRDPKCHLADVVMTTFFWSVTKLRPPRISL